MPSVNQMKVMLQKLLAERFSLASHKDRKDLSAYAITVVKSGVKIKKEENATIPVPGFGGQPQSGFNAHNATLGGFASVMQAQFMDLPVIDQTGFGDTRYTFMVKFTPDPGMRPFGGAAPPPQAQPASSDPSATRPVQRDGAATGIAHAKNEGAGRSDGHRQDRETIFELRRSGGPCCRGRRLARIDGWRLSVGIRRTPRELSP